MAFDVFISHSSKERQVADDLCALLEKADIPCWIAPRNIVPGSHWQASIAQAVRNARLFVLLFSENSNDSEHVARELALADKNQVPILPIKIDASTPTNILEYYLSVCHWLDTSGRTLQEMENEIVKTVSRYLRRKVPEAQAVQEQTVDIFDGDMNQIGVATRAGAHKEGIWHKTVHCWFVGLDNGRPCIWFQQRGNRRKLHCTLMDKTVGRHLKSGESDRDGIESIRNELGIVVSFEHVNYIGVRTSSCIIGENRNREFNSVYLYSFRPAEAKITLNPQEVLGLICFDALSALDLFLERAGSISGRGFFVEENGLVERELTVGLSDFVPYPDGYYAKMCQLAIDFFSSKKSLSL